MNRDQGHVGNSTDGYAYTQSMSYDAFNNLTGRGTQVWSLSSNAFSASYTNNRKTSGGASVTYDEAGNTLSSNQGNPTDSLHWQFDASGRQWRWEEFGPDGPNEKKGEETTFDGDGRRAKVTNLHKMKNFGVWPDWTAIPFYNIYSSVTGQKIS